MTKTIFDHIPKTAGTSVKEALAAAIGERGELPGVSYPHHVLIASAGMRRFLGSHIWFFPGDKLAPEWYYCTLLRDPVDRFLSQYYFHRAHREQVLAGSMTDPVVIAAVNHELEDYLTDKSTDVLRSYVNFQATHFARRLCDDPATLSDAALLEAAISSLEEYDLVGVVSDTQGFIDTYCQDLGLPRQILPTLNVTQNRKRERDISAELTNHIKVSNRVDHALCEWAAQRFQEQRHQISSFFTLSERRSETQRSRPEPQQQAMQTKQATQVTPAAANFGTREIELLSASCLGQHSRSSSVSAGEVVSVQLSCHAFIDEEDLTVGIGVRDAHGNTACGTNTRIQNLPMPVQAGKPLEIAFQFEAWMPPGEYQVTLALHKGITHLDGCYHWVENATRFSVTGAAQAQQTEKSADSTLSIARLA